MKYVAIGELDRLATGRDHELFAADLEARAHQLSQAIRGRRILVIGGAGSIGSATIRRIVAFRPAAIHVVDQNENGLAELVRDLRSRPDGLPVPDFRTYPIDFGSPIVERILSMAPSYDVVLNFAALKHVRSEKDVPSLLQMLDTNIVKAGRLLERLAASGFHGRYFSVSTDKAANPVNLMGASKRAMEHVALSDDFAGGNFESVTSARFANVAFSDGSLLQGFLHRLQKEQPLAAPRNTRRFFVSTSEAGQICTIAAFALGDRQIAIPRLDPAEDLHLLEDIAERVIEAHGLSARHYEDEATARRRVDADVAEGYYPLLLTPLDTSGEKPFEEFAGDDESVTEIGLPNLLTVRYMPAPDGTVLRFVERVAHLIDHPSVPVTKEDVVREVARLVPQFRHIETGRTLDERM
jgi:FlaA1/EpsC-like NDP-sugar epimerase